MRHEAKTAARLVPILLIAATFLALSAASIRHFGITWDEGSVIHDDTSYWEILKRAETFDPRILYIPGYVYAFNTVRALYAQAAIDLFPGADPILVHHSFNIAVSMASLILLYLMVLWISEAPRLAALAAAALALLPQFVGHSQNNPKDLPTLFVFVLATYCILRVGADRRRLTLALASLALGVGLTTRLLSVLIVPIVGLWLVARRPETVRAHLGRYAAVLAGGVAAAIVLWPALWLSPGETLHTLTRELGALRGAPFSVLVLYLGRLQPWTEAPWHYSLVHLLLTTPIALLVFALLSPLAARAWRARSPEKADAVWLGFIWVAVILAADQLAPLHYDGIRHLLAILPGFAILAASGAAFATESLQRVARGWRSPLSRAAFSWSPVAACALVTFLEIASVHPYETAYLNPVANAIGGPNTERWMEVEYWGNAYKEGTEWINRHAEENAVVYFPLGGGTVTGEDIGRFYLDRPIVRGGSLARFQDTSVPRYLIFITRIAMYDDLILGVRANYEPVHTIRRQRATLLEIYSNHAGRRSD